MSQRTLVIATHNQHKTGEFRQLCPGWHVEDLSSHPHIPAPVEDGSTFEENSTIKALHASALLGPDVLVIADDSGLEVDALGGRPGIHSARYSGSGATDSSNREKVLAELNATGATGTARSGRFRCVLVAVQGGRKLAAFHGTVEGTLAESCAGEGGFGYDPLFIPDRHTGTFGTLPPEVKNSLSHRARAMAGLLEWLAER